MVKKSATQNRAAGKKRVSRKKNLTKRVDSPHVWTDGSRWTVYQGELRRLRGRPESTQSLFRVVGEKLPFKSIDKVRAALLQEEVVPNGVYVAHDSMGYARYVGRGDIFGRLKARYKANPAELLYYSFYVIADKKHEREIETLLIRAGGPQLHFNSRKRRIDIAPGNVRDFEAGTRFFERQGKKGRK